VTTAAAAPRPSGARLHIAGVVQGVGFRPFVHRLASECGLGGWVRNDTGGVDVAIEGAPAAIETFVTRLAAEIPPLARIAHVERRAWAGEGRRAFAIAPSVIGGAGSQRVTPDAATCGACLRELFDPADRRYRYPFITCTDCGPRFSVIEAMPYDRQRTSMRRFVPCPACRREYRNAGSRRFHSETNSCPACGPRLWLADPAQRTLEDDAPKAIDAAVHALVAGQIVAIRGLGGFHLACDATNVDAVRRLRARKLRDAKPFAVMVATVAEARLLATVSADDASLLGAPEGPIVVLPALAGSALSPAVSPGLDTVGLLLPTTPLHHLLLDGARRPLVMTSGNRSDEPIATANDEAFARLGTVADLFLVHDREIVARFDDSVVRSGSAGQVMVRRSRGWAPLPLALPVATPLPLLAVGPHLKNTFCLASGDTAFISQHIGDLEDLETLTHFRDALARARGLMRLDPEVAVRDLHPGYLSTRVAAELGCRRIIAVQHHHAHIAAVLAEHGATGPVVGVAFDGTGYGDDGTVWGSEFMVADLARYRRRAHLRPAPLPGGDLAARKPWRAALGYLSLAPEWSTEFESAFASATSTERTVAQLQVRKQVNAPLASSMGRLFDAAAAILGLRSEASFEGQAAMELETLAGSRAARPIPMSVTVDADAHWLIDPIPLLGWLGAQRRAGTDRADLAAAFHDSVAAVTAKVAERIARAEGLDTVALGGGSFQNARLLAGVVERLRSRGLTVLVPRRLPPNDGAISFGQAASAAALLAREL